MIGNMGTSHLNNTNINLGNYGNLTSQNTAVSSNILGGLDFGSNLLSSPTTTSNNINSTNLNITGFSDNNLEITFNCSKVKN